jgi:hypothetical protein
MKALMFKQRGMVEIDFFPDDMYIGRRSSGLEAHYRCVSCEGRFAWDPKIEMYQCMSCGYDMTQKEAIDLCLEYRSEIDLLLMNNGYIKPKKSFWRRLLGG